ncbi:hypothetical protein BDV59DRAFT_200804 [Aspergillus ambiguus]|uniref:cupin domain-containing protein n=1 Tax=Aspergillus ambiguus TaxID=176160 RepID=UPI003CCE103B
MEESTVPPPPDFTRYITTHNDAGQAIIHTDATSTWTNYKNGAMRFHVPYATSEFPVDMNDERDIAAYKKAMADGNLGLVKRGGTVCRVVDFAPNAGQPGLMHRTQSLDFGIVLEGEVDMLLDSGEKRRLHRGDIAIQRGTMHEWRNPSPTQWTRMLFVLQDSKPLTVEGKLLGEDLGAQKEIKGSS